METLQYKRQQLQGRASSILKSGEEREGLGLFNHAAEKVNLAKVGSDG